MAKSWGKFILKVVSVLLFLAVASTTLLFAYGYRFDPVKNDVKKVSIIDVQAKIKDVGLFLDGKQVTNELPYQIKNLVPGFYNVEITKTGFHSWKRMVFVEPDIVSIVNDALLIPENVQNFQKKVVQLSEGVERYIGKDFILEYKKGAQNIRLLSLSSKGKVLDEVIDIARKDVQGLKIYNDRFVVLSFPLRSYALMDISQKSFQFFSLPIEISDFQLSPDGKLLVFLDKGKLILTKISDLQAATTQLPVPIFTDIQAFSFAHDSSLLVLKKGFLYHYYPEQQVKELIDMTTDFYANLSFVRGKNYSALILRDRSDKRWLYYYGGGRKFVLLAQGLKGQPIINGFDQVAFVNDSGTVQYFDPYTEKKLVVFRGKEQNPLRVNSLSMNGSSDESDKVSQYADADLVGWFDDLGHFYMKKDQVLYVSDIFGVNIQKLSDLKENTRLLPVAESVYSMNDLDLESLYFALSE